MPARWALPKPAIGFPPWETWRGFSPLCQWFDCLHLESVILASIQSANQADCRRTPCGASGQHPCLQTRRVITLPATRAHARHKKPDAEGLTRHGASRLPPITSRQECPQPTAWRSAASRAVLFPRQLLAFWPALVPATRRAQKRRCSGNPVR